MFEVFIAFGFVALCAGGLLCFRICRTGALCRRVPRVGEPSAGITGDDSGATEYSVAGLGQNRSLETHLQRVDVYEEVGAPHGEVDCREASLGNYLGDFDKTLSEATSKLSSTVLEELAPSTAPVGNCGVSNEEVGTQPVLVGIDAPLAEGAARIATRACPEPGSLRLVAWMRGQGWRVGVELEPFPSQDSVKLSQAGASLEHDASTRRWLIADAISPVKVEGMQLDGEFVPSMFGEPILMFRIGREPQDVCYATATLSHGDFLFVVPEQWERVGVTDYAPEMVAMANCKAHYVSLLPENNAEIRFRKPDGAILTLKRSPVPELVGTVLEPGCVDGYVTYGGSVPRLHLPNLNDWRLYSEIRLAAGDDQIVRVPVDFTSCFQSLPIATRDIGVYRIDVIDTFGRLRLSERFRFAGGVQALRVDTPLPVPESVGMGHGPVATRFRFQEGWQVANLQGLMPVQPAPGRGEFFIPGSSQYDLTTWEVQNEIGIGLCVPLQVDRVWWQVDSGAVVSMPLPLSRSDFLPTSSVGLTIRLPRSRWVSNLWVGFSEKRSKKYSVRVHEAGLRIPLREFTDCEEVQSFGIHDFSIWFQQAGIDYETVVGWVSVGGKCKLCDKPSQLPSELSEHVADQHLNQLFRSLSKDEFAEMAKRLPSAIYSCGACRHNIVVAAESSPQRLIDRHLTAGCIEETPSSDSVRLISDRQSLINELGFSRVCLQCNQVFQGQEVVTLAEHYLTMHKGIVLSVTR